MSFPQEYEFTKQRGLEHCNICYMTRMKNQIPIITCDNEKCALIFHPLCLKEWFSSVRDTKTFLNMTSGRCPSCKEVNNFYDIFEIYLFSVKCFQCHLTISLFSEIIHSIR